MGVDGTTGKPLNGREVTGVCGVTVFGGTFGGTAFGGTGTFAIFGCFASTGGSSGGVCTSS